MALSASAKALSASCLGFLGFSVERRGLGRVHPLLESFFFGFGKSVSPTTAGARRDEKGPEPSTTIRRTIRTSLCEAAPCLGSKLTKHYLSF